jgi:DNA-binding NarL/FixJ family response regulator
LLVEHNPLFRKGLALLLEWRTGLSSVHAGSLAEAERVLDEAGQELACVVVDLDLPDGGANGVLERTNGLPTLALTSTAPNANARALGADEVLSTEGPVEGMVAAVERLIGQARTPSGPRPSCLPPFTQPRRRVVLRTSPARGSPKLA